VPATGAPRGAPFWEKHVSALEAARASDAYLDPIWANFFILREGFSVLIFYWF
jgi:hypothetical protein